MLSSSLSNIVQSNVIPVVSLENKPLLMANQIAISDNLVKLRLTISLLIAFVLIPYQIFKGKELYGKSSLSIGLAWLSAFIINVITVSLPGRYDNSNVSPEGGPWKSLFAPAPWAFAIWGVIYLLELITTAFIAFPTRNIVINTVKNVVPFWIAGNLYQSLWCFSFRPVFKDYLWFPSTLLGLAAVCMLTAVGIISKDLSNAISQSKQLFSNDVLKLVLLRIPFSLHAGWLSAATLLNINGWASYTKTSLSTQLTLAFASVYLAFALGSTLSISFKDPALAFTIAWATAALAYQIRNKPSVEIDKVAIEALGQTEEILYKLLVVIGVASSATPNIF